jgi:hypothetical protein
LDCASSVATPPAVAGVTVAGVATAGVAGVTVSPAGVADVAAGSAAAVLGASLFVGGVAVVVVEFVLDAPDDVLDASGLCACLAASAAPRAVCVVLELPELVRSCPCVVWPPLPCDRPDVLWL